MNIEKTLLSASILVVTGIVACSSSSSTPSGDTFGSTAAAVAGAADSHCTKAVTVDPATCKAAPAEEADAGTMGDTDGGADTAMGDYGPTLFNSEGDDDDCKYHLKWTTNTIGENVDVKYQVVVTTKADGKPLTGAPVSAEVFLDEHHPAPNSNQATTETTPGTYVVGPIRFDAPGKWTVRFHIHEDCNDSEQSPHGHGAFFAQVP